MTFIFTYSFQRLTQNVANGHLSRRTDPTVTNCECLRQTRSCKINLLHEAYCCYSCYDVYYNKVIQHNAFKKKKNENKKPCYNNLRMFTLGEEETNTKKKKQ